MKLFHLSDLHIGKNLNGYSLSENQEAVLAEIVRAAQKERPDVILICGDIYDRTVPAGEAYKVFDHFLEQLSDLEPAIPVLIIAGNHDSPERLSYAGAFLEKHHIYISVMPPVEQGEYMRKITLEDNWGPVHFYLLPFLKPGYVRGLTEDEIDSYESAVRLVLEREQIDQRERNVLLSHQFYAGKGVDPDTCESEQSVMMAGGLDRVSAELLAGFDYAALGHLHGAQRVGCESVRYCGTPYKYSTSEEHHKKSITVVELKEKGREPEITFIPLSGIQDVRRIRGALTELIALAGGSVCHDFVSVTLTDEEEPYHFREQLEEWYDHILEVRVDNARTREKLMEEVEEVRALQPMEAFARFYEAVRHTSLSQAEQEIMEQIMEEVREEERH